MNDYTTFFFIRSTTCIDGKGKTLSCFGRNTNSAWTFCNFCFLLLCLLVAFMMAVFHLFSFFYSRQESTKANGFKAVRLFVVAIVKLALFCFWNSICRFSFRCCFLFSVVVFMTSSMSRSKSNSKLHHLIRSSMSVFHPYFFCVLLLLLCEMVCACARFFRSFISFLCWNSFIYKMIKWMHVFAEQQKLLGLHKKAYNVSIAEEAKIRPKRMQLMYTRCVCAFMCLCVKL